MKRALMLALMVGALLVLIGPASGAGPSAGVTFGSPGVVSHDGTLRYLAMRAGGGTLVEAVTTQGGVVRRSRFLKGAFGIPLVAYDGSTGGLTRNGAASSSISWPAAGRRHASSSSTRGRCVSVSASR